ncbi:hypothetical protein C8R43DRAFT_1136207 [Mycena crocata]|nr:hypothetical protein C8R43DRAFT_1136207 [Mycena crocata]
MIPLPSGRSLASGSNGYKGRLRSNLQVKIGDLDRMPPELPWFNWLPVGGVLAVDRNADSPSPCSGFGQEGSGMADMYVDSIRADTGYSFSYDASETETRNKVKDVAWNSSYCGLSGQLLGDRNFQLDPSPQSIRFWVGLEGWGASEGLREIVAGYFCVEILGIRARLAVAPRLDIARICVD